MRTLLLATVFALATPTSAQVFGQLGANAPYAGAGYTIALGERSRSSVEALAFVTPEWAEALIGLGQELGASKVVVYAGFELGGTPRAAISLFTAQGPITFFVQFERGEGPDNWGGLAITEVNATGRLNIGLHAERGVGIGLRASLGLGDHLRLHTAVVQDLETDEPIQVVVGFTLTR